MKESIRTDKAPAAIGPYSQAIRSGNFLFLSGQIALDPATGTYDAGSDIRTETERVMENIRAVLDASGFTFAQIVKCTIFLRDMADFQEVNAVYGSYFREDPPARETVAVAGLPKNVRVEISAIAAR